MRFSIAKEYVVVFLLSFSQLIGAGFLVCRHYEVPFEYDYHNYLEMSHGNFDVNVTHRYRFVIPLAAGALAKAIQNVAPQIWEGRAGLWVDKLSFLFVNTVIMSLAAVVLFAFIRSFDCGFLASLIGTLGFSTSFYAIYGVGLPGTDSLYLLGIVAWFLAMRKESFSWLLIAGIVGILAKEAFFMFLPLLLWTRHVSLFQKGIVIICVVAVYMIVRTVINSFVPASNIEEGISNALVQVEAIPNAFKRIGSLKGIAETLSVYTFFYIPALLLLVKKRELAKKIPSYFYLIFPVVIVHILLSVELPRMWLYSFPIVCLMVGLYSEHIVRRTSTTTV